MWKLKKLKLLPINFMEENVITLSQKSVNKSDCISIDGYWYIKEIEAVRLVNMLRKIETQLGV